MHDHHDHDHDNELDEMTARVRALETILVEKGLVDPAAVDAIIDTVRTRCRPPKRRGGGRKAPGPIPISPTWLKAGRHGGYRVAWAYFGRQGEHMVAVFNTDPRRTTSSSARCVPATRGRCWACRPPGTSRPTTVRVPCASRARSCRSSA
jgi:nitrile hydratase